MIIRILFPSNGPSEDCLRQRGPTSQPGVERSGTRTTLCGPLPNPPRGGEGAGNNRIGRHVSTLLKKRKPARHTESSCGLGFVQRLHRPPRTAVNANAQRWSDLCQDGNLPTRRGLSNRLQDLGERPMVIISGPLPAAGRAGEGAVPVDGLQAAPPLQGSRLGWLVEPRWAVGAERGAARGGAGSECRRCAMEQISPVSPTSFLTLTRQFCAAQGGPGPRKIEESRAVVIMQLLFLASVWACPRRPCVPCVGGNVTGALPANSHGCLSRLFAGSRRLRRRLPANNRGKPRIRGVR